MNFNDISPKDAIGFFGIIATFAISVWSLFYTMLATKKAAFINTVTNKRVEWIEKLRQNVGTYVSKAHLWKHLVSIKSSDADKLFEDIDLLGYLIRLQLNPKQELDRTIENLLKRIPSLAAFPSRDVEGFGDALEQVIVLTQKLLKQEWDKVKDESIKGRLS